MTEAKKQTAPPKSPIRALLSRPVAFHPVLARLCGSVTAGLMLSQAIYWSERTEDRDGWFWKSQEEWTREICLSRWEQEGAREQIETLGFLECSRRGMGARTYFRVNFERLEDAIRQNEEIPHSEMRKNRIQKSGKTSLRKNHSQECGKTASRDEEKPQSELRENRIPSLLDSLTTAETTSETTNNSNDVAAIVKAMLPFGDVSNAAVAGMFTACKSKAKDATAEEVVEFIEMKGRTIGDKIRNPIGLLLSTIPGLFDGEPLAAVRRELARRRSVRNIPCHWCHTEYETDGQKHCPYCRAAPDNWHVHASQEVSQSQARTA